MIDTSPSLPHAHIMRVTTSNEFAILGSIKYPYIEKYSLKCASPVVICNNVRGRQHHVYLIENVLLSDHDFTEVRDLWLYFDRCPWMRLWGLLTILLCHNI